MNVYEFLHHTNGSRVFLIGELHQRIDDTAAVLYILTKMLAAGKQLHFFVEYFDSTQNEVIQPYMAATEYHDNPRIADVHAGTTSAHIDHLISQKQWPGHYFNAPAQTFEASWMFPVGIRKIKAILNFANSRNIPVKGFDLPLNRGADGAEFPRKQNGFASFGRWNQGRDTWMAHHLRSFLLNDARIAVCFLGAAHNDGIKYGSRKGTMGLRSAIPDRVVSLKPDFTNTPTAADQFVEDLGRDDYLIRPTALTATMRLTPFQLWRDHHRLRGG